jgi:hypothetical protein
MNDTATAAAPPEPDWKDVRRQLCAALAAVEAAAGGRREAVGPGQWAYMIRVLRGLEEPVALAHMDDSLLRLLTAGAEERGFERGWAARSRLRLVRGGVAAFAPAALVVTRVIRHGAAAAKAHASGTAATAAGGAALAGTLMLTGANSALTPYSTHAAPHHRQVPPAVKVVPAPPSGPALARIPAPRGRHHRRTAPPPVLKAPAPSPPPSAAPGTVPPGTLTVQQASVVLHQTSPGTWTGKLTLYAAGGPVTWTADPAGLELDDDDTGARGLPGGTLADGQGKNIDVSVPDEAVTPGQAWVITLTAPGQEPQQVAVSAGREF